MGFCKVLRVFKETLEPIFVGGVKCPSTELLAHLKLIPPHNSGCTTYEILQQYLLELNKKGRSM